MVKTYNSYREAVDAENPNHEIGKAMHFIVRDGLNPFSGQEYKVTITAVKEISAEEYERGMLEEMRDEVTRE